MFVLVLLWSGIYSGSCTGTQEMNVSPSSLSLGGILEGYSDCTPGGNRGDYLFLPTQEKAIIVEIKMDSFCFESTVIL